MPTLIVIPYKGFYESPIGWIRIQNTKLKVCTVEFLDDAPSSNESSLTNELTEKVILQLKEYFDGIRTEFHLPLMMEGTTFQESVWQQILQVPFGKTQNYLSLAQLLGDANQSRAVGAAVGKNKLALLIPCHRIIGTDKKLTGYAWGVKRKQWLLDFEAKQMGTFDKLF